MTTTETNAAELVIELRCLKIALTASLNVLRLHEQMVRQIEMMADAHDDDALLEAWKAGELHVGECDACKTD